MRRRGEEERSIERIERRKGGRKEEGRKVGGREEGGREEVGGRGFTQIRQHCLPLFAIGTILG